MFNLILRAFHQAITLPLLAPLGSQKQLANFEEQ